MALQRRSIAEINVVPYVDVMLVLLVICMVTAPLITRGVHVVLPEAITKPFLVKDELPVVVTINADGELYLNIGPNPNESIAQDLLQAEIIAALIRTPNRQVLVSGDKKVCYDYVIQAMVLLQKAGISTVGLETSDVGA